MENKKNNTLTIILVLLVIVLGCTLGYFVYDKYFKARLYSVDNSNNSVEVKKIEKELDITSSKVLNLYDLIKDYELYIDFKDDKEEILTADDISYSDKFHLAIYSIKKTQTKCNDIKEEIKEGYKSMLSGLGYLMCGSFEYNQAKDEFEPYEYNLPYTNLYSENDIKSKMHQIFGKDYYKQEEKIKSFGKDYFYISKLNGYVEIYTPTGGFGLLHDSTLESAIQNNDEIILIEKNEFYDNLETKDNYTEYTYKYTFKYNQEDDSYYFYKIEKIKK